MSAPAVSACRPFVAAPVTGVASARDPLEALLRPHLEEIVDRLHDLDRGGVVAIVANTDGTSHVDSGTPRELAGRASILACVIPKLSTTDLTVAVFDRSAGRMIFYATPYAVCPCPRHRNRSTAA